MDEATLPGSLTLLRAHGWQLAAIGLCLAVLAFASLMEAALMRVEMGRLKQLVQEKRRGARRLEYLTTRRQEVLSSLVLLINLSVIVASAYTTEITIRVSGGSERWVPAASLGMIAVILVVCEVTPKTYAVRRAEAVGLALAPLLAGAHAVVRPVGRILYAIAVWMIRHFMVPVIGGEATPTAPVYSDEEVMAMVSAGEADGDIEEDEKDMIHGVIEFADKVTREVMTPRTDMVCVPAETSLLEAARLSEETGYSRLPVYEESVDHIIGIVYAKDMVVALEGDGAGLTAVDIARKPAPVVPESKPAAEVLHLMQRNRLHMAIAIDEYGGTAGLVTIEDLLEEIFGEIRDEYDTESERLHVISDTVLMVDARASIDEIEDRLGVTLPEGEFDSIGGFILDQLGRLPAVGEQVRWEALEFTVERVAENRILRIRVVRTVEEAEGEQGEEAEPEEG